MHLAPWIQAPAPTTSQIDMIQESLSVIANSIALQAASDAAMKKELVEIASRLTDVVEVFACGIGLGIFVWLFCSGLAKLR